MSAEQLPAGSGPQLPQAAVASRRRLSLVWLIPAVAAIAGIWLVYVTLAERGPLITILVQTASGIEAGKTPIRYRDVELGVVEDVSLSSDWQHVLVAARMHKQAEDRLRAGTEFWVESARITAGGVSGLGTLLSGVYIGMRPGDGAPARDFVALDVPPVYQVDVPGKRITLHADRLGSVSAGAPIYFRGIEVGQVLGYRLQDGGDSVNIFGFVREPYDAFIRQETQFWNASGIDVALSGDGLNVRTESLQAILIGGIAFDTPLGASDDTPVAENAIYPLFASYSATQQAQFTQKIPFRMYFYGSVAGLERGSPVVAMGIKMGEVTDVRLETDPETKIVRIPVMIVLEPQRWSVKGETHRSLDDVQQRLARWVKAGLRAQLDSGNLLTGQKVISLAMVPDAPPAEITLEGDVPVLPTIPSDIEMLSEKARSFLARLEKAPIPELVGDVRRTVQEAERLLASASVQQGAQSLREVGPLLDSLRKTAEAARLTLDQATTTLHDAGGAVGPDSALRYDLARLLKELTSTARSLRTLSNFLESNPNALIFGKPAPPGSP